MKQKVRYLFVGWHPTTGEPLYKEMYRMEEVGDTPVDKLETKVWGAKFDASGNFKGRDREMKGEAKRKALLVASILREKKQKGAETLEDLSPAVKKGIETRYLEATKANKERIANAQYKFTDGKVGTPREKSERMNLGK